MFVLQTRGPLILRDLERLRALAARRRCASAFRSRRIAKRCGELYEPHCATFEERLEVVRTLREAGIETYATLAPLLPCDPEELARAAIEASGRDLIGDPLHVRAVKRHGATTREAAFRIARSAGSRRMARSRRFRRRSWSGSTHAARRAGFPFTTGPRGFARLAASMDRSIGGNEIISYNPATGSELGRVRLATRRLRRSCRGPRAKTFERWRMVPAPKRGEIVREIGEELRAAKDELGALVTLEMGKILAEGQRRSAGDDRHRRLRGGSVAAALRTCRCTASGRGTGCMSSGIRWGRWA